MDTGSLQFRTSIGLFLLNKWGNISVKYIEYSKKIILLFYFQFLKTNPQVFAFWKCSAVDFSYSENAMETLNYTYLTFLLKIIELSETIFFVLRKKESQVSKLHVYHHISTVIFVWIMVKFYAGMYLASKILKKCKLIQIYFRWYGSIFRYTKFCRTRYYVFVLFFGNFREKCSRKITIH